MDAVRELFREYAELVGSAICFERYTREVAELPGLYSPPHGALLLAVVPESNAVGQALSPAGCVALRQIADGIGEMKRLYIRPNFQGKGLGRMLVQRIVAEAQAAGYQLLRLDTLPSLERAIALYHSFGFREIPPYGDNPPEAICFELSL
jgi:ribosomal protein S18 acetylase RimI-like enzyme